MIERSGLLAVAALLSAGCSLQDRLPDGVELSGGGRLREQFESFRNREFGAVEPDRDSYLLHRLQLRGEVRYRDEAAALVELVNALSIGQDTPLAPIDEDRFDVLRAQVDWTPSAAPGVRLRAGRQELLLGRGRLVSTREGPNVRQAFDGARVTWDLGAVEQEGSSTADELADAGGADAAAAPRTTLDAFVFAPVELERGVFDDTTRDGELLAGVVASTGARAADEGLVSELYYLLRTRSEAELATSLGDEVRHTVGVRLAGPVSDRLDVDLELMGQLGRIGEDDIRAYAGSAIVEYELAELPWKPRPGVRLDAISGDADPEDGVSGTFDALYPNNSYFNEAAAFAPSNLLSVIATLGFRPAETVSIDLMWDFAWRYDTSDAVYAPPGVPAFDARATGSRFVGQAFTAAGNWDVREDLSLSAGYTHFDAGGAIFGAGGTDLDYLAVWVNWRF